VLSLMPVEVFAAYVNPRRYSMLCLVLCLYLRRCWCPEIGASCIDWGQQTGCHLKTETKSYFRIVVFKEKRGRFIIFRNTEIVAMKVMLTIPKRVLELLPCTPFHVILRAFGRRGKTIRSDALSSLVDRVISSSLT
jgi:hypothetical protein